MYWMQVVKLLKNHLAQVRRIIQMDDTASSQLTFDSIPVARGLFQHFFFFFSFHLKWISKVIVFSTKMSIFSQPLIDRKEFNQSKKLIHVNRKKFMERKKMHSKILIWMPYIQMSFRWHNCSLYKIDWTHAHYTLFQLQQQPHPLHGVYSFIFRFGSFQLINFQTPNCFVHHMNHLNALVFSSREKKNKNRSI